MRGILEAVDPARISHFSVSVASGQVEIEIAHRDLEELAERIGRAIVGEHGVEISSVSLQLTTPTPQSVRFVADIAGRKAIISVKLKITGLLEIGAGLEARISELVGTGSGVLGNLAAGFIEPELAKYRGMTFTPAHFPWLPISLCNPRVTAGPQLRLIATIVQDRRA